MQVRQVTPFNWRVEDNEGNEYFVRINEKGWICSCKVIQRSSCEHILAVKESLVSEHGKS